MKRLALSAFALLALMAVPAHAQVFHSQATPDCEFGFNFTVAGRQPAPVTPAGPTVFVTGYDNRIQACTTWQLMYQSEGFSAVSIELDFAPTSGGVPGSWSVWPAGSTAGTLPLTSTTQSQITAYSYRPWVSVNLSSVTGTGTVYGRVFGWRPWSGGDASTGAAAVHGTAPAGQPVSGNPVLIAGSDGTNVRAVSTDTTGRPLVSARPSGGVNATILSNTQTSAAATAQTLTLTGAVGARVCIYSVALYSSAASTATLVIQDATVTKYDLGTITTAVQAVAFNLGAGGVCGNAGDSMQVVVGAAAAGITTTVSASADRQ